MVEADWVSSVPHLCYQTSRPLSQRGLKAIDAESIDEIRALIDQLRPGGWQGRVDRPCMGVNHAVVGHTKGVEGWETGTVYPCCHAPVALPVSTPATSPP